MMWDWSWWGWGMGLGMFFMVLFWILVIGLIIWAVTRFTRREPGDHANRSNALEIARERYAKGEISKEEFEQIKRDLS